MEKAPSIFKNYKFWLILIGHMLVFILIINAVYNTGIHNITTGLVQKNQLTTSGYYDTNSCCPFDSLIKAVTYNRKKFAQIFIPYLIFIISSCWVWVMVYKSDHINHRKFYNTGFVILFLNFTAWCIVIYAINELCGTC